MTSCLRARIIVAVLGILAFLLISARPTSKRVQEAYGNTRPASVVAQKVHGSGTPELSVRASADAREKSLWGNPAKALNVVFPSKFTGTTQVSCAGFEVNVTPLAANDSSVEVLAKGAFLYREAFDG